jgi:NAD(P)-dependent dehydrogenase (short-subunit alcohol dehydrogenase family)
MRLDGKVAIVTGGGAGIGRATARRFAAEGAKVAVGDISPAAAEETAALIAAEGGEALAVAGDAADPDDCRHLVERTMARFGALHALVNNAGLPSGYDQGTPQERWNLGIEQSLSSVYRMSDVAIPHLLAGGGGAIVSICSIVGNVIGIPIPWYGAAKAGLVGLTRVLAGTYGPQGLRANALCLGAIATQRTLIYQDEDNPIRNTYIARTPLGRIGRPEEAAAAAAFLVSDDASYLTGQAIILDGGYSIGV